MTDTVTAADLVIPVLGPCSHRSPISDILDERAMHFVGSADKVLLDDRVSNVFSYASKADVPAFELAGPRHTIFWKPEDVRAGIVTCGGLCPGLNNVVRGVALELWYGYGVRHILGFRYGYEGLVERFGHEPLTLDPRFVSRIHHQGGTVLGSSRGKQSIDEMLDYLMKLGINQLYVVGGDGTLRGATAIADGAQARDYPLAVVGIPKTIDNDIQFIDRSFGFETAFSEAVRVVQAANVEAMGSRNGVGLVKLMGRHSGFIACHAALASTDVNIVLIPEVPIALEGEKGLLAYLERRLARSGHAVIVVAEGAGQELLPATGDKDASGNARLQDIGTFLRDRINAHFRAKQTEINLKYIDPSYHIRSVPASAPDSLTCWNMARNAVHAAMAGNTRTIVGRWHGRFVHVPIAMATRKRKEVDPGGDLWVSVVEATGQPTSFVSPA